MFENLYIVVAMVGNQFSFLISTRREKHSTTNQSLERSPIVSALWPRMPTFPVEKRLSTLFHSRFFFVDSILWGKAFRNTLKIAIRLANRVRTRFPRNSRINDRILKLLHPWLARFPIFTLPYEKISVRYSFLSSKWNVSFKQIVYIHG